VGGTALKLPYSRNSIKRRGEKKMKKGGRRRKRGRRLKKGEG
jgi:hypothetical protein